jgi:hypothetical protein
MAVWIFSTGYNQATILSDCSPLNSVCIEFYIYSIIIYAHMYTWNNASKNQYLWYDAWQVNYQSCWIHLAFTFDNQSNLLSIYFNGVPMASARFTPSALATTKINQSMTAYIGSGQGPTNRNTFGGLIDQLSISFYVKNNSEILDEATLLCSYNFESDNVNADSGPNNIPAYSQDVYRSLLDNQSNLLFNSTDSYFQSSGFTLLMSNFYACTIAFWIRPVIIMSDMLKPAIAILQFASKVQQVSTDSYVCFLTFYIVNITGEPYFQITFGQLNMYVAVSSTTVKNNTWTHVGMSYSNGSKFSVYLDGNLYGYGVDSRYSLLLYNPRLAVTVGGSYFNDTTTVNPTNYESRLCFTQNPEFNYTQMYGEIDDLKVFARALSDLEFATLASSKNITT